MALCEQCGSINLVRAQPGFSDRVVTLFTSKRPIVCRRCRWRGRRDWSDDDLRALMNYGAGGAELDPSLTVLDREPQVAAKTGARKSRPRRSRNKTAKGSEAFDLATLDPANGATIQPQVAETFEPVTVHRTHGRRRIRGNRQKRTRRREFIAT